MRIPLLTRAHRSWFRHSVAFLTLLMSASCQLALAADCPCMLGNRGEREAPGGLAALQSRARAAFAASDQSSFAVARNDLAPREGRPPISAARLGGEVGAVAVSAIVSSAVALYVGFAGSWTCNTAECGLLVVGGASALYASGCAGGAWMAGSIGKEHVPYLYPFIGAAAGAAIGYVLLEKNQFADRGAATTAVLLPPIGALGGAILGREYDRPPRISLGANVHLTHGPLADRPLEMKATGLEMELLAATF
jgi:hypothetical protein